MNRSHIRQGNEGRRLRAPVPALRSARSDTLPAAPSRHRSDSGFGNELREELTSIEMVHLDTDARVGLQTRCGCELRGSAANQLAVNEHAGTRAGRARVVKRERDAVPLALLLIGRRRGRLLEVGFEAVGAQLVTAVLASEAVLAVVLARFAASVRVGLVPVSRNAQGQLSHDALTAHSIG